MTRLSAARAEEDRLTAQLFEALGSSLDVRTILKEAYPLLTRLVPADYGALGVSGSPDAEGFEWTVAELPSAFFASYAEMAAHDFVRSAVAQKPRLVLRDQDMVSRSELEQNPLYRRARELGAPLEQVMAVMLHLDDRWQSGLSLYRDQARPFSEIERARLQRVTPALANAVRNCQAFGAAADWKLALERLLESPAGAVVLASRQGVEISRSDGATALLEKWFEPHERRSLRLPPALTGVLQQAPSNELPALWQKHRVGQTLQVSFSQLTGHFGDARWLLRFEEHPTADALPGAWSAQLTSREREIVRCVLQTWDNRLIGEMLGCTEGTVKKHLTHVYTKLGLKGRTALIVASAETRVAKSIATEKS
jgi:DNA-binding CsgD family transcriptional regulator